MTFLFIYHILITIFLSTCLQQSKLKGTGFTKKITYIYIHVSELEEKWKKMEMEKEESDENLQ